MIEVALQCTNTLPALRPTMSTVVSILEGRSFIEKVVSGMGIPSHDQKLKTVKKEYHLSEDENMNECQTESMSIDLPWTGTSISDVVDLYPTKPDTEYWNRRDRRSP
ncbi:hypothetical protein ACHQM5_018249 [Ranunculus cassubicifolius]